MKFDLLTSKQNMGLVLKQTNQPIMIDEVSVTNGLKDNE